MNICLYPFIIFFHHILIIFSWQYLRAADFFKKGDLNNLIVFMFKLWLFLITVLLFKYICNMNLATLHFTAAYVNKI